MNKSELVFTAIDVFGHPLQNAKRYDGITCVKDIAYGDNPLQTGDLYFKTGLNKEEDKKGLLLYIHGGGFIKGDKKHRVTMGEYYAKEDFYVYNINYRLPPEVDIHGQIEDCVKALNFLPTLAESYNIDLNNIFITGDSSGACQVTFLAALKYSEELRKVLGYSEIEIDIKGLMLMSGIYDVEALGNNLKLFGVIPQTASMILNFKLKNDLSNLKDYEFYDYLSPTGFVNENWCPVFISWAEDDIFCKGQGETMYRILNENKVDVKKHSVKGFTNIHCYHLFLTTNKYAEECMQMSVDFMKDLSKEKVVL